MNIIAMDSETKGFSWWAGETAFIATTSDQHRDWVYDLSKPTESLAFQRQLCAADVIVCHNLSFDVHMVRATIGFDLLDLLDEGVRLEDTDLMSRVAWPESTYGEHDGFKLGSLTEHFLGRDGKAGQQAIKDAAKDMGINLNTTPQAYYLVWQKHPDLMERYAMQDTRDTFDLYAALCDYLGEPGREGQARIAELERQVVPTMIRAEARGTALDAEAVTALHKDYTGRQRQLFDSLSVILGPEALGGAGSHEALLEALLGEGIPLHRTTETGGLSTDKFALQEFAAEFPVVAEYQEFRTTEKFLSTYIEPMVGTTEVHPSFRQIGAWTGRMSCMRPNMQNIPVRAGNEVRECFVARPGFKLVVADYDSIEMRILAHYLGAAGTPYRDLINGGFDPHAYMASQLYGGKPEDYFKGTPGEKQRAVAKNSLFAIVYGAGGKRLCDMNDLPTGPPMKADAWEIRNGIPGYYEGGPSYAQGKALARQIKSNVPGYGALMKRVRAKVEGTGFITTLLGRKQALARDKGYIGMSALVQGSAADVMKMGLAAADPIIDNHGGHILLVVHDEIVAEVPEGQAEAALAGLRHALETAVELDPPLLTSGVICDNYGQAK